LKGVNMSKNDVIKEIIKLIKEERPDTSNDTIDKIRERFFKASEDEVFRTYDAFNRFGVNAILDVI
jgi:hypothetical protein